SPGGKQGGGQPQEAGRQAALDDVERALKEGRDADALDAARRAGKVALDKPEHKAVLASLSLDEDYFAQVKDGAIDPDKDAGKQAIKDLGDTDTASGYFQLGQLHELLATQGKFADEAARARAWDDALAAYKKGAEKAKGDDKLLRRFKAAERRVEQL